MTDMKLPLYGTFRRGKSAFSIHLRQRFLVVDEEISVGTMTDMKTLWVPAFEFTETDPTPPDPPQSDPQSD